MAQPIPDTSFVLATSELNATMEYVPNLMPFHMEYNGPAPVSTYMKVEVEKRGVGMPLGGGGGGGGKEEEAEDKVKTDEAGVVDADMKLREAKVEASGQGDWKEGRYVSTFRGRLMHGLDVRLPGGYSGLVLRSEGGSSKEASKGEEKANRRRRRNDARSEMPAEEDEEDEEEGERDQETVLVPSGMFSNMRVWEGDMPVDGGRDEYIRSLREWSALCGEIHRV